MSPIPTPSKTINQLTHDVDERLKEIRAKSIGYSGIAQCLCEGCGSVLLVSIFDDENEQEAYCADCLNRKLRALMAARTEFPTPKTRTECGYCLKAAPLPHCRWCADCRDRHQIAV